MKIDVGYMDARLLVKPSWNLARAVKGTTSANLRNAPVVSARIFVMVLVLV